ncbi:MAG: 4Fe-4S dicluster domain-containing protein [Candidatus Zixiibacteriota bacterium]|nr:MAG: 4Fe-4S dicluster domain-containing protein [candidate division Zixibacteria bacterium]
MKNRFIVNPDLCTGCRTCELACSFTHAIEGLRGQTRIYPLDGGFKDLWIPVVCLQCDDAACVKSCLVDALRRNSETGAIDLNQEVCVKCMACVAACPFGCSVVDQQHKLVVKCDLCGGDPACAHFCPTKALKWNPIEPQTRKVAV